MIVFDFLGAQWLLRQNWVSLSWIALCFGDTECEVPALTWGSTQGMRHRLMWKGKQIDVEKQIHWEGVQTVLLHLGHQYNSKSKSTVTVSAMSNPGCSTAIPLGGTTIRIFIMQTCNDQRCTPSVY